MIRAAVSLALCRASRAERRQSTLPETASFSGRQLTATSCPKPDSRKTTHSTSYRRGRRKPESRHSIDMNQRPKLESEKGGLNGRFWVSPPLSRLSAVAPIADV